MKLPIFYSKQVIISQDKLIDYVLSETHATGKFKAKFFRNLGFNETNIHLFEKALHKLAKSQEVTDVVSSKYGTKYIIDGPIDTPRGKVVNVRTIWIIERGQFNPRFVTVYPV